MQVEHKTEKGTVLFVKVPKGINKIKIYNYSRAGIWYGDAEPKGLNAWKNKLPKGFRLIALTSEVSEEQAKMMVDCVDALHDLYRDYQPFKFVNYNNALSSFTSLMQHLQVHEVNPLGIRPFSQSSEDWEHEDVEDATEEWEKINERCGKWIVLFKPN